MNPSRLRLGPSQSGALTDASPGIGAVAGAKGLPGSAFAPPEYPHTRSFSNQTPVLSSLSGHEVNEIAQPAVGPRRRPPKAEATGSNPVGRAMISISNAIVRVKPRFAPGGLIASDP